MNINEMNLDQATDAMIQISDALSFILEDKEVVQLIEDIGSSERGSWLEWIPKYLPRITTTAFRRHRDSLYKIIGALALQDAKKAGKMNFREVVQLLQENWETLAGFFPSSGTAAETNETISP